MPIIRTQLVVELPKKCPKCESKVDYVNALNSKAKLFMVFCKNSRCRYCAEVQVKVYKDGKDREVKVNCH